MTNLGVPVLSLLPKPLEIEQGLAQLEKSGQFEAIIRAKGTVEVETS